MVAMKANDTLHVSSAGAENIFEGDKFDVSEEEARVLERRGLATRVGGKAEPSAPANKMAEEPQNKVIGAAAVKEQRVPLTLKGKK